MRHHRTNGFTLIEILTALAIGVILTSIAVSSLGGAQGKYAVRQARSTFATLHARARAGAIETGEITRLFVDTSKDSVWIVRNGTTLETIRFADAFGVDIQGSATQIRLCMSPRGFAESSCNSFTSAETLTFSSRGESASLTIQTLGQLSY